MISGKTLFEHDKPPDSSVTILKRMDRLKLDMKIQDILERMMLLQIIIMK